METYFEKYFNVLSEKTIINNPNLYGFSKYSGENYIKETKTLDAQFMVKRLTAISLLLMAVFLVFQIS